MKKNAIFRICIWSVIALVLIGVLLFFLFSGRSPILNFGDNWSFGMVVHTYPNAEAYTAGNGEIAEEVKEIDIEWIDGSIQILPYDGDTIRVTENCDHAANDDTCVHWLCENGKLTIQYCAGKHFFGFTKFGQKDLTVEIPISIIDSLRKVSIECVSASVQLNSLVLADLDVESVSGNITLFSVSADQMELDNTSGDINLSDSKVTDASFSTVSGTINAAGEMKQIDAESISGKITLNLINQPHEADFETVSGNVKLVCPVEIGCRIQMDSVSGDFNTTYATQKSNGIYTIAPESVGEDKYVLYPTYSMDSVSGDFYLYKP